MDWKVNGRGLTRDIQATLSVQSQPASFVGTGTSEIGGKQKPASISGDCRDERIPAPGGCLLSRILCRKIERRRRAGYEYISAVVHGDCICFIVAAATQISRKDNEARGVHLGHECGSSALTRAIELALRLQWLNSGEACRARCTSHVRIAYAIDGDAARFIRIAVT